MRKILLRDYRLISFFMSALIIGTVLSFMENSILVQTIAGFFLAGSALAMYYGIMIYAIRICCKNKIYIRISRKEKIRIVIITFLSMCFVIRECSLNHIIYSWDTFITWGPAVNYSQQMFIQPLLVIHDLYYSINNFDYNNFLGLLMALPIRIVGADFTLYVLCGWIMFLVPAIILLSVNINLLLYKFRWKQVPYSLLCGTFFLIPAIYIPMFYGYMYVSALLPGAVILMIFLSIDWNSRPDYRLLTIIGLLSLMLVIQNRTLAYMVLGYLYAGICYIVSFSLDKKDRWKIIYRMVSSYSYIFFLDLVILGLFFRGLLKRSLFNNLKESYSAWGGGLYFYQKVISVLDYFGFFLVIMIIIGILICVKKKEGRSYILFLSIWILVPIILINMILTMNSHHIYTILVPMLSIIGLVISFFYQCTYKKLYIMILSFLFLLNFTYVFSGIIENPVKHVGEIYKPVVRNDVDDIKHISLDLIDIEKETSGKIYIVSSAVTLNDDVFRKVNFPATFEAIPNLQYTHHVDLRDGFNVSFFDSDIIVVMDPIQLHLLPKDQQVVVKLANSLLENTPIAKHFTMKKEYTLHPGKALAGKENNDSSDVIVKVYQKIAPFTKNDVNYLENEFDQIYADYPTLFHDRFEQYKKEHF